MKTEIVILIGAAFPFIWGAAHLFPKRSVLQGFGEISEDNRNILSMKRIIEGITLIFIGTLVTLTAVIEAQNIIATLVYLSASACLIALTAISLFTGFRIKLLPFRICPIIFTSSAILITTGRALL